MPQSLIWIIGIVFASVLGLLCIWFFRPNRSNIHPDLRWEAWDVVDDDRHNAFTDMVAWKNAYYIAYRSARSHLSHESKIVICQSYHLKQWEKLAELSIEDEDVRDPKLIVHDDQLILYALKNRTRLIKNYTTVFSVSKDGEEWSEWQEVTPRGLIFWRPKRFRQSWFAVAFPFTQDEIQLLQSDDGKTWSVVSGIHDGLKHDEFEILFHSQDHVIGVARINGRTSSDVIGSTDSSIIATSRAPFQIWSIKQSDVTRLDGPVLFEYKDQVYAAGRFEPPTWLRKFNLIPRKRLSLFRVSESGLVYLSDLPSGGDCGYADVEINHKTLHLSYYTNRIDRDYPWILGQLLPTKIRMAQLDLDSLTTIGTG